MRKIITVFEKRWPSLGNVRRPGLCAFHATQGCGASPSPLPSSSLPPPGPPPEAPLPGTTSPNDRVARRSQLAKQLALGCTKKENSASSVPLRKRFWAEVSVREAKDGFHIFLDSRPLRTPSKNILVVPKNKHHLAIAIALEWDYMVTTSQAVKQHYAPLTSLTARAIDLETADKENAKTLREDIVNLALEYLHTDTLLCWAPDVPPSTTFKFGDNKHSGMRNGAGLREIQMQAAQDVVRYLTGNVWPGVSLTPSLQSNSILPTPQPEHTRKTIRNWLWKLPPWELAGLERAVIATKSLLIATRLLVGWADLPATQADRKSQAIFGIDEAARASNIELQWQIDTWGAVEDTHDVNDEDLKRQLGGAVLLMSKDPALPDA